MKEEQEEQLDTPQYGDLDPKLKSVSESLINREKIEGTPFTLITVLDEGAMITMGDFLIIEKQETKEQALKKLETNKWDVVLRIISSVVTRAIMNAAEAKREMSKNVQEENEE